MIPRPMALASVEYLARSLDQPPAPTTAVRQPESFRRWGAAASASAARAAAAPEAAPALGTGTPQQARFPVDARLNARLALVRCDLSCLAVDCVVVPNNEVCLASDWHLPLAPPPRLPRLARCRAARARRPIAPVIFEI